jgi:hypothetical protein
VAKSWATTSKTVTFAESPFWFLAFLALQAALTAAVILATVAMARLVFRRRDAADRGDA